MEICALISAQRAYFQTGATRPLAARQAALRRLQDAVLRHETELHAALWQDLHKAPAEAYLTETGMVLSELRCHLRHLAQWMKPQRVHTPLAQFRATSLLSPEPYGVTLILAPWNYPLQLCLLPLIGAISAGNCAIVHPSAEAPATCRAVAQLVAECFPPHYVAVVEGGYETSLALLQERFDYLFFTGSVSMGRRVMELASRHLTPVTLELGGKSPVLLHESADLALAARRIAFGKVLNAGQTCVAPDFVCLPRSMQSAFVQAYAQALQVFFPDGSYEDYPSIVNERHFLRLQRLMEGGTIALGGTCDASLRRILPTVLTEVSPDAPILQEEIFGPILPLLPYDRWEEALAFLQAQEKPLAFYLFTQDRSSEKEVLRRCSFGGGCINDTIVHLATEQLPFGGVGSSGMGQYHGKRSFDTFTHTRSILRKAKFPDLSLRYHPYTAEKERWIRRFLR